MRPIEDDKYTETLRSANFYKKKPVKIIDMIYERQLPMRDLPSSGGAYELNGICVGKNIVDKKSFFDFIKYLANKNVDVLEDGNVIKALFTIHAFKGEWIRNIVNWKKGSYNLEKQVTSIARHLFCKYPIPKFMDSVWFNAKDIDIKLYIHMGKGGSPRTFDKFNISLTKKESHYFLNAPDNYNVEEAILWAKALAIGGDERLIRSFMESNIFTALRQSLNDQRKNWEFWYTVMRFFVEQQMIDTNLIAPICDYINHVKNDHRQIPRPGGGWQYLPPENPDFKIKGRTIASLVRGMEQWHKESGSKSRSGIPQKWEGFAIEDYKVSYGKDEKKRTYSFTQLKNAASLRSEGRAHGHCVAGYANSCNNGRTSIWSMCVDDNFIHKNLLTIEVSPDHKIVQCRGKNNRLATESEWRIVENFAQKRNLGFSRWVSYN